MALQPRSAKTGLSHILLVGGLVFAQASASARPPARPLPRLPPGLHVAPGKENFHGDDSLSLSPSPDLALKLEGQRKAESLANFVEGGRLEEEGELDEALATYRKVLNFDPGQAQLAARVAALLTRAEEYPEAIDVLKDAIKANPNAAGPYLQLAFIYTKYLKKPEEAVKYASQAIARSPDQIEGYQSLCEIYAETGNVRRALGALERATKVASDNPFFWTRLGKLYASVISNSNVPPRADELQRLNEIFKHAATHAKDDPNVLREVADYYASSQRIELAIPLYLRVLDLQPDDPTAREKLATGFVLTNQRAKAVEMLESVIKSHPEKYQTYDVLAQLLDEDGRALAREKKADEARAQFAKAAANYEQSLLLNPARGAATLRLGELFVGPLRQSERAVKLLIEARRRFADAPEFTYLLALAQREAEHPKDAIVTFEEALHEAESTGSEIANARFYFEYAATAEQAKFYDKAAELFKKSIALDPAHAAEAYNYLGFMWVEQNAHLDEADDLIHHALQLDPNNGAYLDSLGWLDFRRGKYSDALGELLRAAQNLGRDDAVVFEHIGDAYGKLNRNPEALEYWRKAIALTPSNKALADKIESTKTRISKGGPAENPHK